MTLPVIDSFCRAYPDVELTLLTSKSGAAIARSVIRLSNLKVIAINKKDYSGLQQSMLMHTIFSLLVVESTILSVWKEA